MPDYWDWRPQSEPISADTLRACAGVAAQGEFTFDRDRAGMAGLVLLERECLDRAGTWPSFLRGTLSPYCSGLDPLDAAHLSVEQRGGLSIGSAIADHAKPAVLRLLVRGKDLAGWWHWRVRSALPRWVGLRMGYNGAASRRDTVAAWHFQDFGTRPVKSPDAMSSLWSGCASSCDHDRAIVVTKVLSRGTRVALSTSSPSVFVPLAQAPRDHQDGERDPCTKDGPVRAYLVDSGRSGDLPRATIRPLSL